MWKKSKMHSATIPDWLWMNFLWCFCKSPDLCYKKPSDIKNCFRGGSQNKWQNNTSLIKRRLGKSFWDATNSKEMNFSVPSLLEMCLCMHSLSIYKFFHDVCHCLAFMVRCQNEKIVYTGKLILHGDLCYGEQILKSIHS